MIGSLERVRRDVRRAAEVLHPRTLIRLRDTGAFSRDRLSAALRVLPWVAGRGPSLGVASHLHAVAQPDRTAVVDRFGTRTWAQLDARANRLARALLGLGIEPGDEIATVLRNGAAQIETILAAQKLGVVVAPLNTWARADELRKIFERRVPAALVYDVRHGGDVGPALPRTVPLVAVGDEGDPLPGSRPYEELLAERDGDPLPFVTRRRGSTDLVIHTSGTTGAPKAAARGAAASAVPAIVSLLQVVPYRRDDVMYVPAPMFHSFGLMSMAAAVVIGMPVVVPDAFDPQESLAAIDEHGVTAASFLPVMVRRIGDLPAEAREAHDVSSLRIVLTSGSAMPPALRAHATELFGQVLYDLYGSTEAGWVAVATPHDVVTRPDAVGKPAPGVDVAIVGEDGARLPTGETGQIHVRGGMRFAGYLSGESADEHAGYLNLGDRGWLDDEGYLHVAGRSDDMAVIGGENVYPAEVEEVIDRLDGVEDVAVVGIDDEEYGQVLAAFVVGDVEVVDVERVCKEHLASFKVPRRIERVDDLPRTATGKVRRTDLRARVHPADA